MSYSSNWGYGEKTKGTISGNLESIDDPFNQRRYNGNKELHFQYLPSFIQSMSTNTLSYTLTINGDFEESSTTIISRLLNEKFNDKDMTAETNAEFFIAVPASLCLSNMIRTERDVILITGGGITNTNANANADEDEDEEEEEHPHVAIINTMKKQVLEQLGLRLSVSISTASKCIGKKRAVKGLQPQDGTQYLPAALLFLLEGYLLHCEYFHLALPKNQTGVVACRIDGNGNSDSKCDCDVISLEAMALTRSTDNRVAFKQSTGTTTTTTGPLLVKASSLRKDKRNNIDDDYTSMPSITARLHYSTFAYRLLSAESCISLSRALETPLLNATSDSSNTRWKCVEAAKEALRCLREGDCMQMLGIHDAQTYELYLPKVHSILCGSDIDNSVAADDDGFLTSLETRSRNQGYLLFLPHNKRSYSRYWTLRCGKVKGGFWTEEGMEASHSNSRKKSNEQEVDSMDSMDSDSDIENYTETATATAPDNAFPIDTCLRVSPSHSMGNREKQTASQLVPRALLAAGVVEIPYLSRMRIVEATSRLVQTLQKWELIMTDSVLVSN